MVSGAILGGRVGEGCVPRETCEKSGTGDTDDSARSEVRRLRNFEPGTSNFESRLSRAQRTNDALRRECAALAGCSKRLSSKAAASEEARRYQLHFVRAVRPQIGSWRTEKPLQCFRSPMDSPSRGVSERSGNEAGGFFQHPARAARRTCDSALFWLRRSTCPV